MKKTIFKILLVIILIEIMAILGLISIKLNDLYYKHNELVKYINKNL